MSNDRDDLIKAEAYKRYPFGMGLHGAFVEGAEWAISAQKPTNVALVPADNAVAVPNSIYSIISPKPEPMPSLEDLLYDFSTLDDDLEDRLTRFTMRYPIYNRELREMAVQLVEDAALLAQPTPEPCRAPEGWRPVAEAPRDGTWFWAFFPSRCEEDRQQVCRWIEECDWIDASDSMNGDPTHFRPLPSPPDQVVEGVTDTYRRCPMYGDHGFASCPKCGAEADTGCPEFDKKIRTSYVPYSPVDGGRL